MKKLLLLKRASPEETPAAEEVVEETPAAEEVVEETPAAEEVVEETPVAEEVAEARWTINKLTRLNLFFEKKRNFERIKLCVLSFFLNLF